VFESVLNQLFDTSRRFCEAAEGASIPCYVVGGIAVFLHVDERDPMAARLTPDIDVVIFRRDLDALLAVADTQSFRCRSDTATFEVLDRHWRSEVHLLFIGEKVRPNYPEVVPASEPVRSARGILIAPVADLVRMKLTSFRLKDKVHIQDMDGVGLITPAIEADLPPLLRDRLAEVRATE
jgi:hypothetical protein